MAAGWGGSFVAGDKWTIVTADNRPSAHYEHTLVITKSAPMLLTAA
jgi:methionyl aminopeptidase